MGIIISGVGEGSRFVGLPWFREAVRVALGFDPYPGTLNVHLVDEAAVARWRQIHAEGGRRLNPPPPEACGGTLVPVLIENTIPASVIIPDVTRHEADLLEVIAAVHVKRHLGRSDGDPIALSRHPASRGRPR